MTDRISAAQLAEIEKRANDATEGPWFIEGNTVMNATRSYTVVLFGESAEDDFDSAFVACSRSDVPALCEEIRAAWGEAEAATRLLRRAAQSVHFLAGHALPFDDCQAANCLHWRALVGSESPSSKVATNE